MRTTLTVEDGLAARLKAAAKRRNVSFKEIVNDALRRGLQPADETRKAIPFKVRPISMGSISAELRPDL